MWFSNARIRRTRRLTVGALMWAYVIIAGSALAASPPKLGDYEGSDAGTMVVTMASMEQGIQLNMAIVRLDSPGRTWLDAMPSGWFQRPNFKEPYGERPALIPSRLQQRGGDHELRVLGNVRTLRLQPGSYLLEGVTVRTDGAFGYATQSFDLNIKFEVSAGKVIYLGEVLPIRAGLVTEVVDPREGWRICVTDQHVRDLKIIENQGIDVKDAILVAPPH